jgi:hypothetical protein
MERSNSDPMMYICGCKLVLVVEVTWNHHGEGNEAHPILESQSVNRQGVVTQCSDTQWQK